MTPRLSFPTANARATPAAKRRKRPTVLLTAAPDGAPGVMVPARTVNPLNNRRHWQVVAMESGLARQTTRHLCRGKLPTTLPLTVRLTRYSPGELDDDNLRGATKPVRDGVADLFAGDDSRRSGLTFQYAQVKAKGHGVLVDVQEATR